MHFFNTISGYFGIINIDPLQLFQQVYEYKPYPLDVSLDCAGGDQLL